MDQTAFIKPHTALRFYIMIILALQWRSNEQIPQYQASGLAKTNTRNLEAQALSHQHPTLPDYRPQSLTS